ncbi:STAS domain-containing protein [Streptomyces sp. NBC_00448]|uniref:STAS domain-containing protein n=1 Tax=Streptomyces sp. NBC_00448 TaxID=2903652 RepID=UPI002E215793
MSVTEPVSAAGNHLLAHGDDPAQSRTATFRDIGSGLTIRTVERNGRCRAAVCGEIDLATAAGVGSVLAHCLERSPGGLDLDLGDVLFFDCVGLNMLLRLRSRAIDRNVTLTVSALAPTVARILELSGTRGLFGSPEEAGPTPRIVRPARWRSAAGRRHA